MNANTLTQQASPEKIEVLSADESFPPMVARRTRRHPTQQWAFGSDHRAQIKQATIASVVLLLWVWSDPRECEMVTR